MPQQYDIIPYGGYDIKPYNAPAPEREKSWWEEIATPANAVRFGLSTIGDVLTPFTFGTSPFIGGAAGEGIGRWMEGQDFDPTIMALEGAANYMPGAGKLERTGAKALAKYALKSAGHGAVQGAVGTFPRHQAAKGTLWEPSEWEMPSLGEFASQTGGGAVVGGVVGPTAAYGMKKLGHTASAPVHTKTDVDLTVPPPPPKKPHISAADFIRMRDAKTPDVPKAYAPNNNWDGPTRTEWTNRGYVPGGVDPDGRIFWKPGKQGPKTAPPTVESAPAATGKVHPDEGFTFPKEELTTEKQESLEADGWKVVGKNLRGDSIFKRLITEDEGSLGDFGKLKSIVKGMFRDKEPKSYEYRDLTPEEANIQADVARGLDWENSSVDKMEGKGPIGSLYGQRKGTVSVSDNVVQRRALEAKLEALPDDSAYPPDSKRGRQLRNAKREIIDQINRFITEDQGAIDPEDEPFAQLFRWGKKKLGNRPIGLPVHGDEQIPDLAFQPDEGVSTTREFSERFLPGPDVTNPTSREQINAETTTAPEGRMNEIVTSYPSILEEAQTIYNETNPQIISENLRRYSAEEKEVWTRFNEAQSNRLKHNIPVPAELQAAYNRIFRLKALAQAKYERASVRQLKGRPETVANRLKGFWQEEEGTSNWMNWTTEWLINKMRKSGKDITPDEASTIHARMKQEGTLPGGDEPVPVIPDIDEAGMMDPATKNSFVDHIQTALDYWQRRFNEFVQVGDLEGAKLARAKMDEAEQVANRLVDRDASGRPITDPDHVTDANLEREWNEHEARMNQPYEDPMDPRHLDSHSLEDLQRYLTSSSLSPEVRAGIEQRIREIQQHRDYLDRFDRQPAEEDQFGPKPEIPPLDKWDADQNPTGEPPSRNIAQVAGDLHDALNVGNGSQIPRLLDEIKRMIANETDPARIQANLGEVRSYVDSVEDPAQKAIFEDLYNSAHAKLWETLPYNPPDESSYSPLTPMQRGWDSSANEIWQKALDLGINPDDYLLSDLYEAVRLRELENGGQGPSEAFDEGIPPEGEGGLDVSGMRQQNVLGGGIPGEQMPGPRGIADISIDAPRPLGEGQLELPTGPRGEPTLDEYGIAQNRDWTPEDIWRINQERLQRNPAADRLKAPFDKQPEQMDMGDELGDTLIQDYLAKENAIPPEMRDLSEYGPDKVSPPEGTANDTGGPQYRHPTAQRWDAYMRQLDAEGAPDSAYREIMSTGSKNTLKKGETWRGRVQKAIEYFESRMPPLDTADDTGLPPVGGGSRPPQKKRGFIREAMDFSRGVTTILDLSASLRQGLPLAFSKEWRTSWGVQRRSLTSEGAYQKSLADIKSRELFQGEVNYKTGKVEKSLADKANVKIMDVDAPSMNGREESIAGNWIGKIPGARASNRAYTAFLNQLRADTFESLFKDADALFKAGVEGAKDPRTDMVFLKEIGDFVNTATGRGPLETKGFTGKTHSFEQNAKLFTEIFFSPRLIASRVRMLNPATYAFASPFVRKQYLKAAFTTAATWTTVATVAKMAGAEVSLDPLSPDFGKIRIGNTRIDPGGGFQQFLVAFSRLVSGKTSPSSGGPERELGQGYRAETRGSIAQRFATNKLHPVLKFANDLMFASKYQPVNVGDRAIQMFTPLIVQDIIELAKEDPSLLALIPAIGVGMGSQTYEKGETKGKVIPTKSDWIFQGGAPVNPFEATNPYNPR